MSRHDILLELHDDDDGADGLLWLRDYQTHAQQLPENGLGGAQVIDGGPQMRLCLESGDYVSL